MRRRWRNTGNRGSGKKWSKKSLFALGQNRSLGIDRWIHRDQLSSEGKMFCYFLFCLSYESVWHRSWVSRIWNSVTLLTRDIVCACCAVWKNLGRAMWLWGVTVPSPISSWLRSTDQVNRVRRNANKQIAQILKAAGFKQQVKKLVISSGVETEIRIILSNNKSRSVGRDYSNNQHACICMQMIYGKTHFIKAGNQTVVK